MELYLRSNTDFSIEDETGKKYSVKKARKLVQNGKVSNFNLAFHRLIIYNYDLEKVKDYYEKEEKL